MPQTGSPGIILKMAVEYPISNKECPISKEADSWQLDEKTPKILQKITKMQRNSSLNRTQDKDIEDNVHPASLGRVAVLSDFNTVHSSTQPNPTTAQTTLIPRGIGSVSLCPLWYFFSSSLYHRRHKGTEKRNKAKLRFLLENRPFWPKMIRLCNPVRGLYS